MAVYYKFKSAKDYNSIPIDGHFISVGNLKEKIFESKQLGRGTDFDLLVTNAQTDEEYLDESMLIPKNTSVLIRRVPGRPRMPIVTAQHPEPNEPMVENGSDDQSVKSGNVGIDSSAVKYPDDLEWDEFGNDLYAIPEIMPTQSSNPALDAPPPSKIDEDSKIKALIDTPALDWQRQSADAYGSGRGFGRGMGGRMMGGRGFGRGGGGGGLDRKNPPPGYVCHRCKVPGHFIQHCPTNGDPNFDIKRVKPPTGIPKSMLMATPDGSYALPSGAVAVLRPNEAAFEKEIEGLPSNRPVGDLPPELHCPLCKEVIKDAVLTSKCCFKSFCDKCIRDYIISRSICVCGATNTLADDLLPNKTLRDTINRILESNNSSGENGGSAFQVQDMESRNPQPRPPSPAQSAASKGERVVEAVAQKIEPVKEPEVTERVSATHQISEKVRATKVFDISEATAESLSFKEPAFQGSAPLADDEVQQKLLSGEAAKKKKKKKARLPLNGPPEMPWRTPQDFPVENYMMPPMPPAPYNPYWNGMQPGMEGFMGPYGGGNVPPYMGFGGPGPFDMPFAPPVLPQDPFAGPGYMFPPFGPPPQRDLAEYAMGFNAGPPPMSREEFEARKADLQRKRQFERRGESREQLPKERERDREYYIGNSREVSSGGGGGGDVSSMKAKAGHHVPSSSEHLHHRQRSPPPDRRSSRDPELPRPSSSKRKSEHDHHHRDRDLDDHRETHKRHSKEDDYYPEDDDHHHQRHHHHHQPEHVDDRHSHSHHRSSSHQHHLKSSRTTPEPQPVAAGAPKPSSTSDKKYKPSVFSRISFPEEGQPPAASKKRKLSSTSAAGGDTASTPSGSQHSHRGGPSSNGYYDDHHKTSSAVSTTRKSSVPPPPVDIDYESSEDDDDDRHFKRRPSRYESPPPAAGGDWEEPIRQHSSRGSRDKERDKERGGHSKHR